jgi:hypothetical protein
MSGVCVLLFSVNPSIMDASLGLFGEAAPYRSYFDVRPNCRNSMSDTRACFPVMKTEWSRISQAMPSEVSSPVSSGRHISTEKAVVRCKPLTAAKTLHPIRTSMPSRLGLGFYGGPVGRPIGSGGRCRVRAWRPRW